jgi:hypothetical protein
MANNDPFQSGADKKKKSDATIDKNISKSKANSRKANVSRNQQVLRNAKKTLAPIIANQLTNTLIQITNQNGKLQELVDRTNAIADAATTPEQVAQAIAAKNAALTLINNQEQKIISVQNTIKNISTFIRIFSTIVTILSAIPIPTAVPPGIGIPVNLITRISRAIERANALVESLSVILAIVGPILGMMISDLENLKAQLRDPILKIDQTATNIPNLNLITGINNFGTNFGSYKGFTFALKEENNPKFNVRGNKRHYAVAINRNNVEVAKSDFSFTQDPNDLIEQLKLIIDQQNLQS